MEEFVVAQLYLLSQFEIHQKHKRLYFWIFPTVLAALALGLFFLQFRSTPILAISFAFLWLLFFPAFNRRSQIKMQRDMYDFLKQDASNEPQRFSLSENYLYAEEQGIEIKLHGPHINWIADLANVIVIAWGGNIALHIPKQDVEGIESFGVALEAFAKGNGVPYTKNHKWKY